MFLCDDPVHETCLERHNAANTASECNLNIPAGSASPCPSDDETNILCPVCAGNPSPSTMRHYRLLEKSIEEERSLLRDWSINECVACGDVGDLIICDLCSCEPAEEIQIHPDQRRTRSQKRKMSESKQQFRKDTLHNFVRSISFVLMTHHFSFVTPSINLQSGHS